MDVTNIPFNSFIRITRSSPEKDSLELGLADNMKNHLGTFHASAQFALAEACSGLALQSSFPHLADSVVPVLRKADVKFKRPANTDITAKTGIATDERQRFEHQLTRKKRATIAVPVDIIDRDGTVTMSGVYEWFVQKIVSKGLDTAAGLSGFGDCEKQEAGGVRRDSSLPHGL